MAKSTIINTAFLEKRQYERVPYRSQVKVLLASGQTIMVRALDISSGGLGIVVHVSPNLGTKFKIGFNLISGKGQVTSHIAAVEVVRSVYSGLENGFIVGLIFNDLDKNTQLAIAAYVRFKTT